MNETDRVRARTVASEWERCGREGRSRGVTARTGGNIALTQTMRSLERSFQGLRKAYNPVYRPRKSGDIYSAFVAHPPSPSPPSHVHPATHFSCVGKPGWCFNPFPFYERLLRARLAGPFAPICRFWKRAGCPPAALRTGRLGSETQSHSAVIS